VRSKFFCLSALLILISSAPAQTGQWTTYAHDPQRSGYASDEHTFTTKNVGSLGLLWKTVVPNQPLSLNGLTAPLMMAHVATSSGSKNIVLVGASSDHVYALDADSGQLLWKQDFSLNQARPDGVEWLCPFALNATPVIDPAKERAFVVASDGRLYTLALSDGHALIPPVQFVPAFSKMWSLNYSGGVLYSSISQDCNHVHSGIIAIDPDRPGRPVTRFYSAVNGGAGVWGRGGPSIDFDGFIYGASGDAPFDPAADEFGDTVLKLEPRTLQLHGYYTPDTWQYLTRRDLDMGTSTPVIFRWRDRVLTAVGGKEGAIYVTDTATMSGSDHHAAAYISPRYTNATQTFEGQGIWGVMTAWKDAGGETWLYVPSWGLPTEAAKFPTSYDAVKNGSIMAFQVVSAADGKPTLKPAWISADIAVPDPAVVTGGVLFVLGTGENTQQVNGGDINQLLVAREARNTGHAILHALDARTGKELWQSGDAISAWTHFSGLAVGGGKVFATTHDGAVYAFGLRTSTTPAARVTVIPAPPSDKVVAHKETPLGAVKMPECGEANVTFRQRCAMCHGADGKGTLPRAPNFTDFGWQSSKKDQELMDAVTNGTNNGMPAFSGQISTQQIDQLVHCLVRGLAAAPAGR
jgi:outer membrane protein assembly factor BamB/cytochrome c553